MAKGMTLEELRTALSSDATIENDSLKLELKNVKENASAEIEKYRTEVKKYQSWFEKLANRCLILTDGSMCLHCGISGCPYALDNNDWDAVCRVMKKNHMERTPDTAAILSGLIQDRQRKKLRKGVA